MSRTVLITGASKGLGYSLAKIFAAEGDHVIALSRTTQTLKKLQKEFPHSTIEAHSIDVTSESKIKRLVNNIKRKKINIDILINNAGYGGGLSRVEDTTIKEYNKFIDINLTSAFLMSKYFIPIFRKQKSGLLINISSMAGKRGVPRLFAYSASKFGMQALTECIAKENDDLENFKCITICPGGMNSKMRSDIFGKKDAARQQSTDFVAGLINDVINNKIPLNSGSDIVIRHGKITAIHPLPGA